jgi:hypothetical protein
MKSEAAYVDRDVRPDSCEQGLLADDFTGSLHEHDENVKCTSAQMKGTAGFLKKSLCRVQTKRPE